MWLEESLAGVEQEAEDMRVGMRMRRAMSESGMAVYRRFKQLSKTIQSKVKGNFRQPQNEASGLQVESAKSQPPVDAS